MDDDEGMQEGDDFDFQFFRGIDRHSLIQDIDQLIDVAVRVEFGEQRVALKVAALLLFQVEDRETVDQVANQPIQGLLRDVDAADDLQDVRDGGREGHS